MKLERDELARVLYQAVALCGSGYVEGVPDDEQTADQLYAVVVDTAVDFGSLADAIFAAELGS